MKHKERNIIRKSIVVCLLASIAAASLCAAVPGDPDGMRAAVTESRTLSVKVYPEIGIVFGFSDSHPAAGADYLEPFTGGALVPDATGANMAGTFYLYHVTTPDMRGYEISVQATALKLDGGNEYVGYDIMIDDQYPVYSSVGKSGPWKEGIPGDGRTYDIAIDTGGGHDTVLLSEKTKFDNIWYRDLRIAVPAHVLLDDRHAAGKTWARIAEESWTGTITATLTTEGGTQP